MSRKKLAIVEDNPDNRLLLDAMLGDNYDLLEYESGSEALAGIQEEYPNLILMDISLPGMDGTQVLKELRAKQEFESIPVIALTAHAMSGDREKYLQLGFDAYISKPIVDQDALEETIKALLA